MATFTRTTATEWVCVDCHLTIAGYSSDELGHEHPIPFDGVADFEDVTNGTDPNECEHHDGRSWDEWTDADPDLHSECDHDSFSLHPCAGCGSTLAGDRYAVTVSYVEHHEPFTTDTPMARAMAQGHLMRKGHALAGYYTPPVGGITTLVRTCCE